MVRARWCCAWVRRPVKGSPRPDRLSCNRLMRLVEKAGPLDRDANGRYGFLHGSGSFIQVAGTTSRLDINGGRPRLIAEQSPDLANGGAQRIDDNVDYGTWSFGAIAFTYLRAPCGHQPRRVRTELLTEGEFHALIVGRACQDDHHCRRQNAVRHRTDEGHGQAKR